MAIFCKAPPNPLDKTATREHEDEMIRAKECLQGQHGFESEEECQWALEPPPNIVGFASGNFLAIARVGDTSVVRKVERERFDSLLLDEAQSNYS